MIPDPVDDRRAKRLTPRQLGRPAAEPRSPVDGNWPDPLFAAHRRERSRRRPDPLVVVTCADCGRELAEVRPGTSVLCRSCRTWSGGATESGVLA